MKHYIDMTTYPRLSHFQYFRSMAYPYVGLTANVDVTNLINRARALGGSTFHAVLWAVSQAANAVPQLRQRIEGDNIIEFDHCLVGHTVALEDGTFCNCTTDCRRSLEEFLPYARREQDEAKKHHGFVNTDEDETGMIFTSCVPWVAFTQCIQPAPIPADCNPRIVMGKYIHEGDRVLMPLHIQCNHALVDGLHIARFYQAFENINNSL